MHLVKFLKKMNIFKQSDHFLPKNSPPDQLDTKQTLTIKNSDSIFL